MHALTVNQTLEELNLQDFDIRKEGIEGIIDNLSHFPSLRKLWLRRNEILHSSDHTMDLSQIMVREMELTVNHVLQVLDIYKWWVRDNNQLLLMNRYFHLNRAGRQFLKDDSSHRLPLGIWPILL